MNPEDEKYASQLIERMKQQNQMMQPIKMPERKPEMLDGGSNPINEQAALAKMKMLPS